MLLKNNIAEVFHVFVESPEKEFHLRELSRKTKLSTTAVSNALDILQKKHIITKREMGIYDFFRANMKEKNFIELRKALEIIERIG